VLGCRRDALLVPCYWLRVRLSCNTHVARLLVALAGGARFFRDADRIDTVGQIASWRCDMLSKANAGGCGEAWKGASPVSACAFTRSHSSETVMHASSASNVSALRPIPRCSGTTPLDGAASMATCSRQERH
jgi:hypothetical protein